MKRILILITDLEIGGTPTVVRELGIRLSKAMDAQIDVACLSKWGPVADQIVSAGLRAYALNASGPSDVAAVGRLVGLIHQNEYETVFSFLVHANVASAGARVACPGVKRWIQSIQTTQPNPQWHWLAQTAASLAAERIVVPSESVASVARKWAHVPGDKIVVIPNAIDVDDFSASTASPNQIGFLGRLDPVKRVPDLVEAISLLDDPKLHLHIFGEGAERAVIEKAIQHFQLQDRATMHGAVVRPQDALAKIGTLVLPSEAEGFGLVLIEAMASSVPVVATNVPGIRDVVRDGETGILVPVANPQAIAEAIRKVTQDSELRERLIRQGLADVRERFSWEGVIGQYVKLLM